MLFDDGLGIKKAAFLNAAEKCSIALMRFLGGAYAFSFFCIGEKLSDLSENYYRECYSLISENIPDSFSDTEEAYLSFLSDFMFRQRRGLARIKGYTEDGKVFS